jgi:hypothetical protein
MHSEAAVNGVVREDFICSVTSAGRARTSEPTWPDFVGRFGELATDVQHAMDLAATPVDHRRGEGM